MEITNGGGGGLGVGKPTRHTADSEQSIACEHGREEKHVKFQRLQNENSPKIESECRHVL